MRQHTVDSRSEMADREPASFREETIARCRNPEEWTTEEMDAHTARGGTSDVWLRMGKIKFGETVPKATSRAAFNPIPPKKMAVWRKYDPRPTPIHFADGTVDKKRLPFIAAMRPAA